MCRESFSDFRSRLHEFELPGAHSIYWTFRSRDIFERLDPYLKRLCDIRHIFQTTTEIRRLEKVDIGGLMGGTISRKIGDLLDHFNTLYNKWTNIQYDPLDSNEKLFEKDLTKFKQEADTMERKLALQFILAFNECYTVEAMVKFLKMTGALLQRLIIYAQVKGKIKRVSQAIDQELAVAKKIYDR